MSTPWKLVCLGRAQGEEFFLVSPSTTLSSPSIVMWIFSSSLSIYVLLNIMKTIIILIFITIIITVLRPNFFLIQRWHLMMIDETWRGHLMMVDKTWRWHLMLIAIPKMTLDDGWYPEDDICSLTVDKICWLGVEESQELWRLSRWKEGLFDHSKSLNL